MPDRDEFPIPNIIDPPQRRCIVFPIPDDQQHVQVVAGLFQQLTYWYNWQRDSQKRGKDVAAVYAEIFRGIDWGYPIHGGACTPIFTQDEQVMVKTSDSDLVGDYLSKKIVAGENVAIEIDRGVGYETLSIAATIPPVPPPFSVGDYKYSAQSVNHDGWLLCDATEYSQETYAELFAVIGHAFAGGAPPSTTFRLPAMAGFMPMTEGDLGNGIVYTLGSVQGQNFVQLTESELPSHNHRLQSSASVALNRSNGGVTSSATGLAAAGIFITGTPPQLNTLDRGNNIPHENRPPSITIGNLFIYSGVI